MHDRIREFGLAALVCFALAVLSINLFLSASVAAGGGQDDGMARLLLALLQVFSILLVSLTTGMALASSLLAIREAMDSGNSDTWRVIWALVMVFAFPLGLVLYFFLGRKHLQPRVQLHKPS